MNLAKNDAESVWDNQRTNKINKQPKKQMITAVNKHYKTSTPVTVLAWDEY